MCARPCPGEKHGDVWVDTKRSMQVYRDWVALTRPAGQVSPDGLRRPLWPGRPLAGGGGGLLLKTTGRGQDKARKRGFMISPARPSPGTH